VVQQIPQSAGGDQGFISRGLDLVGITVCLFLLDVTQGSVVLIIFIFGLIAFFFFLMIVVMVIVLR
jgi:hypothetical protein